MTPGRGHNDHAGMPAGKSQTGFLELLHNRERGQLREKFFLEMIPLGIKTCGESEDFSHGFPEFDIFEAKKRFPDSGNVYCVLKRKVAKMRFLPKNDPLLG